MLIIKTIAALHQHLAAYKRPALVPTMGHLHAGHLALVQAARPLCDVLVVSIFINRLQFLPHEDFDTYPRTLDADCAALAGTGCDVVFAPLESEIYPERQVFTVQPPPELADILEGHFRPGFFVGVATVVQKLFGCVQPHVVVLGQKDYQQLMVVRRMVQQFAQPIDVVGVATLRAPDGLALSSRNAYLTADQRTQAVHLAMTLQSMVQALRNGVTDIATIEANAASALNARSWQTDYLTVRRRSDLMQPAASEVTTLRDNDGLVVLGAARLGSTRLIDNLEV